MDRKILLETNEKAREKAWSKYMEQLNSLDHFLQSNITLNATTKVDFQINGLYSPSDWLVFVLRSFYTSKLSLRWTKQLNKKNLHQKLRNQTSQYGIWSIRMILVRQKAVRTTGWKSWDTHWMTTIKDSFTFTHPWVPWSLYKYAWLYSLSTFLRQNLRSDGNPWLFDI